MIIKRRYEEVIRRFVSNLKLDILVTRGVFDMEYYLIYIPALTGMNKYAVGNYYSTYQGGEIIWKLGYTYLLNDFNTKWHYKILDICGLKGVMEKKLRETGVWK